MFTLKIRPDRLIVGGNIARSCTVAIAAAAVIVSSAATAAPSWPSGLGCATPTSTANAFASWRGAPVGVASGWAPWKTGWSDMLAYMSGTQPRVLKAAGGGNASIGLGLFPVGGNLADCALGRYSGYHRDIGSRLVANGAGDVELRLGWEPNLPNYPWHAVGRPADQWKACFTNAAVAIKSAAPGVRVAWHMAKKGRLNVATIWPDAAPVANVGVSHYDDDQARFGTETANGSPWGLRAWLAFAQARGKKLSMAEWGVGRRGDNPAYVENMHRFFQEAGAGLAHEAYFNCGSYRLYPSTRLPKTATRYKDLW